MIHGVSVPKPHISPLSVANFLTLSRNSNPQTRSRFTVFNCSAPTDPVHLKIWVNPEPQLSSPSSTAVHPQIQFQKALKAALPNMESPTVGQPIVISAIAPMHGPVVRYSIVELLRKYRHDALHGHRCNSTLQAISHDAAETLMFL